MIGSDGLCDVPPSENVKDVKSLFSKTKRKVKVANVQVLPPPPPPPSVLSGVLSKGLLVSSDGEGWEQEYQRLDKYLHTCGLKIEKVEADGSCLFSSFAVHFPDSTSDSLRREAVQYMLAHSEEFEPFVDLEVYPGGFLDYCTRMLRPATWGSQLELQALSQARGVNIYVFQTGNKATVKMITFDSATSPLVTVSYHDGEHYNAVVRLEFDDVTFTVDRAEEMLKVAVPNQSADCYTDVNIHHAKIKKKGMFN